MSDTPRTDAASVSREFIAREMNVYSHKFVLAGPMRDLERELAAITAERNEAHVELVRMVRRAERAEAERNEARAAAERLRAAAEQALEVLESLQGGCTDANDGTVDAITVWCPEVVEALHVALKEPK